MSDRDDIYFAIQDLEYARSVIYSQLVHGTNSTMFDWCKQAETTIKRAKEAYDRLGRSGHG